MAIPIAENWQGQLCVEALWKLEDGGYAYVFRPVDRRKRRWEFFILTQQEAERMQHEACSTWNNMRITL